MTRRTVSLLVALVLSLVTGLRAQDESPSPSPLAHEPFRSESPVPAENPSPTGTPNTVETPNANETPAATPAETASPLPTPNLPLVANADATDTARYLAGMPISNESSLANLAKDPRWQAHSHAMNSAFARLDEHQLNNIRLWQTDFLAPLTAGSKVCLYYFSGPDFLYADAFYPDCTTYVLAGLEPIETIPDLRVMSAGALAGTLENIESSLTALLNFSFFWTKDMHVDFQKGQVKGPLPIIFVFLARTGKQLQQVEYVSLDRDGHLLSGNGGSVHGVKVSFSDTNGSVQKTLYYFTTDLSDDGLKHNPNLLKFSETLGPAHVFLKAASYLMHHAAFATVRSFLLQQAVTLLQDDSGIPVKYFAPDKWTLRFFGSYTAPIALFKTEYQSDLRQYYETSSPKPLTFGFGYQYNRHNSTLILATKK
jgi:hypothetical protein